LSKGETQLTPYYGQKESGAGKGHRLEAQTEQYQKNIAGPVNFACTALLFILAHSIEYFLEIEKRHSA
jgi:hypothetical protein